MADRPIIFSATMVRALLDGRKTQTRRVIKGVGRDNCIQVRKATKTRGGVRAHVMDAAPYAVGDRLWVRENWQALRQGDFLPTCDLRSADIRYAATDPLADADKDVRGYSWRPSIHMPREASRLTLEVTNVRVERLQDITDEDARAEGIYAVGEVAGAPAWGYDVAGAVPLGGQKNICAQPAGWSTPRHGFCGLWRRINGDASWDANPWVVAVTFTVHRGNVDRLPAAQAAVA